MMLTKKEWLLEASITLKSIAKKIDKEVVLADLSIGVENNSNHAIIGQNGSGKSSILKILVGIIEKDAGIAYIHGCLLYTSPSPRD